MERPLSGASRRQLRQLEAPVSETSITLGLVIAIAGFGSFAASPATGAPTLQLQVLDAKTVVVRGSGFPDERLLVSADMNVPHASVACYTDFTRVALVKGD